MVVVELSLGSLRNRVVVREALSALPAAITASHDEVLRFVARHALNGRGLSLVDAHLLAPVLLTLGTRIWTRDRRLRELAESFGIAHAE